MDYSKFITPEIMKEIADRLNSTPNQMNSRTGMVQSPELWATETDPEALIEGDVLIDVKLIGDKWVPVK